MSSAPAAAPKSLASTEQSPAAPPAPAPAMSSFRETLHFAARNRKLVFGLSVTFLMLLFAIVGPWFAQHPAL